MLYYTDGGCRDNGCNSNIGSWAFVNTDNSTVFCQKISNTTNNRTEMIAIINTLRCIGDHNSTINIITDSGLCFKGWNWWIDGWIRNGWKTNNKKPVLNDDLWKELYKIAYHTPFKLGHCRGHNKDKDVNNAFWNNIVDQACTMAMDFNDHNVHILQYDHINKTLKEIGIKEDGWNGIYSSAGCKPPTKR